VRSVSTVRNSDVCLENEQAKTVAIPHLGFAVRSWEKFMFIQINHEQLREEIQSAGTFTDSCAYLM
jgi:hypothetical protein